MPPSRSHRRTGAVMVALDLIVLRIGWVPPAELMAHLTRPRRWVDAVGTDGATLELARAGLWLAAAWLAVAMIAVLVSGLPGTLGRIGRSVAGRTVPAVLRHTIVAALGASVVLVPVAAGASTTGSHHGATRAPTAAARTTASLGSPGSVGTRATALAGGAGWPWSTAGPASAAPANPVPWPRSAPTRSAAGPRSGDVVVGAGDCLWAIAAHRLGPTADAHRIAAETERWYRANAATIGADPGLIHPGQHLHQPTEEGR